jgi:two-component system nitrate/nitrite response regulator NarL
MSKGRLILVGESRLFREALQHVLESEDMTIAAQVSYLSEVPQTLNSIGTGADLIVYDQCNTSVDDFSALKEITQKFTQVAIVILADHVDQAGLDWAIAGGACGFLPKSVSPAALRLSLDIIQLRENLFAGPAMRPKDRPMCAEPLAATDTPLVRAPLSARECQILNCLEMGLPNKVIARNLDMAEATVKVHLKSVLRKINAGNRTQAAVWAMNNRQNLSAGSCG